MYLPCTISFCLIFCRRLHHTLFEPPLCVCHCREYVGNCRLDGPQTSASLAITINPLRLLHTVIYAIKEHIQTARCSALPACASVAKRSSHSRSRRIQVCPQECRARKRCWQSDYHTSLSLSVSLCYWLIISMGFPCVPGEDA